MKTKLLAKDLYTLVAFAEALAAVLAKKREELGLSIDVEALLKGGIGAARYTTDVYFVVLSGASPSPEAAGYPAEAERMRDRSVRQLRRPRDAIVYGAPRHWRARILSRSLATWHRKRRDDPR
jgi:hypothetical protein